GVHSRGSTLTDEFTSRAGRTLAATDEFDRAVPVAFQAAAKSGDRKAASRASRPARIWSLEGARLLEILTFYRPVYTEACRPAQRLRKEQCGSTSLPLSSLPYSDHRCGLRRIAPDDPQNSVDFPAPDAASSDYIYLVGRRSCA
ncbi:conserved hypothetical protein, partial [Ricinus communis]